ncbi:hypothetical protein PG994_013756 [Apiospora phragmitis]|uniref:C2H2-type domain-containing protein n=1 Tax=Apiospora phragmitis TaxID=2905665 RepID=A0ABR1T2D9_9PEZI
MDSSRQQNLRRHLKKDPHNVLDCPSPEKACGKVYPNSKAMLRHLRRDTQDHQGMNIDEIHKLAVSHGNKEAITKSSPDQWVYEIFRVEKRERRGRNKAAAAKGQSEQVNIDDKTADKRRTGISANYQWIEMDNYGGYESDPDLWWNQ